MQMELNRILSSNKILEVEQCFFQNEKGGCWSFCIRYIAQATPIHQSANNTKDKIDYKNMLSESEFSIFSCLREIRKQLAAADAVPAYAVFTDEELSNIAKLPIIESSKLIGIKGIGDKKVQKYGQKMIELYQQKIDKNEKGESFT